MTLHIRNGQRFNIYAPAEIDGIRYPNFRDPYVQLALGIKEVDEPAPPEDYSEDAYYRQELDDAPYVVYTRKPDEVIAQAQLARDQEAARRYLLDTDWYIIRAAETGKPVPAEVLEKRAAAREIL